MDIIDKYFEVAGDKLDRQVMKYFGFNKELEKEAQLRLANKLGHDGIDGIIKEKVKGVIRIMSGGYDIRVSINNWDLYQSKTRHLDDEEYWSIDNVIVTVDPKSTVELMNNGYEYELGDLFNYSTFDDIDKINAEYDTEDDPITEDAIIEIKYEVQDVIKAWLYDNVYPLTGVSFIDINPNDGGEELIEQIEGLNVRNFALYANLFELLYKAFESDEMESTYRELSKKIHGNKQHILDYFYNFIKQNEEYLSSKTNVVESLVRINSLMTDKPKKN